MSNQNDIRNHLLHFSNEGCIKIDSTRNESGSLIGLSFLYRISYQVSQTIKIMLICTENVQKIAVSLV